ncbi:MAG TPA: hypothetical protein PK079_06820 [Leptospiraceae bacterium]|nr:hypothetical protein [Leptospiraceae bacterium]HMW07008.1 hypothetical protein [Leptospiraceae bacterium]HMX33406.1 hypothetical protein [Leptospiraceae bacterium]HMY30344.1 hypothetical protein [Leptospiraceae bacterium]HMZ65132.1 hypothetical protein [Leptospiraceae bacterium]
MIEYFVRRATRKIGQVMKTTEQIMTTPILDLFQPEKSIDILLNAADEQLKEDYKVSLNLRYINELIYIQVVEETEHLDTFTIDSNKGKVYLEGNFITRYYPLAKFFRIESVNYKVELTPIWVKNNHVRFRISNFQIWDSRPRRFDIVRFISSFDFFHKRYIIQTIAKLFPNFLSLTRLNNEIRVNLNYFLNKVNPAHNIEIKKLSAHNHKILFQVRSNIIIKSLMDMFGIDIVVVEPIQDTDSFINEYGI